MPVAARPVVAVRAGLGLRRLALVAGLAVLGVSSTACPSSSTTEARHGGPLVRLEGPRHKVDLAPGDYALGGDNPLVTIVVFTDYSCPPCGRTWKVMDNLVEDYGDDIRVVYRAYTVQSIPRSEQAAEAAFAAGAQGKFWPMHRRLFEQGGDFDRPTLLAHAEALGLDVAKFTDDIDTGAYSGDRVRHRRQAKGLGVVGLPASFVNGQFMAGYADEATWHGVIDDQLAQARAKVQGGIPRAELYASLMREATTTPVGATDDEQKLRKKLADRTASSTIDPSKIVAPKADQRYDVRIGDAPATGSDKAPVEVVMFFDFKCPYCRRAWLQEVGVLIRSQPDGVRLGVRQLPLEIHPTARGAALASLAAGRQGRYWGMFDRLVEHEGSLGRSDFVTFANELGLDEDKFLADLGDPALAQQIEADIDLANRVGVTGTPGFFVNGRYMSGFSPGTLTSMVEEEQAAAKAQTDAGIAATEVVDVLMKDAIGADRFPNAAAADAAAAGGEATP